ncbi:MAG: helix-turn-helix domain-containing protein [Proteobacteria bacterium]|nr:helix-turn-helix domain-containing protein [Pseudomonadota bacterium]
MSQQLIRDILRGLEKEHNFTHKEAVNALSEHLGRSEFTIYGYLSGKPVPSMVIKFLKADPP